MIKFYLAMALLPLYYILIGSVLLIYDINIFLEGGSKGILPLTSAVSLLFIYLRKSKLKQIDDQKKLDSIYAGKENVEFKSIEEFD